MVQPSQGRHRCLSPCRPAYFCLPPPPPDHLTQPEDPVSPSPCLTPSFLPHPGECIALSSNWAPHRRLLASAHSSCRVHRHALVPASRKVSCPPTSWARTHIFLKTQSRRVFAEFYQATTFLILTLLAAAVCAESNNQQDMEPEDSEPYLNTLDSDTTLATTDTEAAGPTPPPPPNNKKCSGSPVPPRRRCGP
ncbi:hypothetical protein B0H16DRAFT_1611396 [Mycena metata]|uniref:Uncharacterized protein n=1 Tax=Mycena metata TaxID=1033252 RepID=A0AAD7HC22_9AGAR|nr:hypothetical protein B0H16DRAFT_1611396 [Mycena metata]